VSRWPRDMNLPYFSKYKCKSRLKGKKLYPDKIV
jgi:hypothetical protein